MFTVPPASKKILESLHLGANDLQFMEADFLATAIEKILDPRVAVSLDIILEESLRISVDEFYNEYTNAVNEDRSWIYYDGNTSSGAVQLLHSPVELTLIEPLLTQEIVDARRKYSWDDVFYQFSKLSTRQEIAQDRTTIIGSTYMADEAASSFGTRIFQTQTSPEDLPEDSDQADLTLTLYNLAPDEVPFVPGYRLMSAIHNQYYSFVTDPENDPYAPCDVLIDKERQDTLAGIYQSMGMDALAEKLKDADTLTVDQLVAFIRSESVYYVPDELSPDSDFLPGPGDTEVHRLEDLSGNVSDGKLFVQCSGSAQFLKYSLEHLFGVGCAGIITGRAIQGTMPDIDNDGHAQAVFANSERQYILDATPSRDELAPDGNLGGTGFLGMPGQNRPRFKRPATVDGLPYGQMPDRPKKSISEQASDLLNGLTEQLKATFDMPDNETLYSYVTSLPAHDPLRQTLELLYQFDRGYVTDEPAVLAKINYIKKCAESLPQERYKLNIGQYSPAFLDHLRGTASNLYSIIRYS